MMKTCETSGCSNWAQWRLTYGEGEDKRIVKVCHVHYVNRKDDEGVKCAFVGTVPTLGAQSTEHTRH
jgi:hypothetical protein